MQRVARCQLYCARSAAILGGAVALMAFLYGVFLLGAVEHTAAQTKAQHTAGQLASRVSALETQYFAIIRSITPEQAKALGFSAPFKTTTVFATAASKELSLQGFKSF